MAKTIFSEDFSAGAGVPMAPLSDGAATNFTLQLLHAADQEGGIPALEDAPNFSAVLAALADADYGQHATLTLSSGDVFIPGVFFEASDDAFGAPGVGDILIQNALGFDAVSFGNHEFDFGTATLAELIGGDGVADFDGTAFPYLGGNLSVAGDANLAPLAVADGGAPQPGTISGSVVIERGGEKIGVVSAVTPILASISSPGLGVGVQPAGFSGTPTAAELDALAAVIQADVDALLAANPDMNKVILLSHMQQLDIERGLATRLTGVDIVIGGGSNTLLADPGDDLRDGDAAQGGYPEILTAADTNPVALVNTDGNYRYVGQLVIEFDEAGVIVPGSVDPAVSGAYATDDAGVAALGAEGLVDPEIQAIVDALGAVIAAQEGNVFGATEVYLNGRRGSVRIEETNLGNLTADANLAIANRLVQGSDDETPIVVSLKNGGGIRDDIGDFTVPPGGSVPVGTPPEAIPGVREAGEVSQNAIANALRFNNDLVALTLTAEEIRALLEHGVAATTLDDANTQGRFPQVGGIEFSFDPLATPGARIETLALVDAHGNATEILVEDGALVADPAATYRLVTLGFLAEPRFDPETGAFIGGGDGYPFPNFNTEPTIEIEEEDGSTRILAVETGDPALVERVNFTALLAEGDRSGAAQFADTGSEQDALAEYLAAEFPLEAPFAMPDTPRDGDERIQNLAFREDTVDAGLPAFTLELLHAADQEANASAIANIPNFATIMNALEAQDLGDDGVADNTLRLSSGDAFIPGVFFSASEAAFGAGGIADIQIQNELGFEAIALGNHEFDFGTRVLSELIAGQDVTDDSDPDDGFVDTVPEPIGTILGGDFEGARFPYLSANLNFGSDGFLAPLETAGGQDVATLANAVTSSAVAERGGELIGIVGATTPTLASISSPGDVGVRPQPFGANPTPAELDALAAEIQAEVDQLLADNPSMNKVVLLAHMQQLDIELALAERLTDVDVIVAGGSNTRLFDADDRIRDGDSDQGEYPIFVDNAGGTKTAVVNTDGTYKYVGRLVLDFDDAGNVIASSYDAAVSGAYATDVGGLFAVTDGLPTGLPLEESQQVGDVADGPATGAINVAHFDPDTFEVTIVGAYSGLSAPLSPVGAADAEGNPQSAVHLHLGARGENGPILRNLKVSESDDASGFFTGTFTLTEDEAQALLLGGVYVNVHTEANPAGELRGQIEFAVEGDATLGGQTDPQIQEIVDAIQAQIVATEGNVFGISDVFLNGNRSGVPGDADGVRTQETNLGNLTADANLAAARESDADVAISIKNGGGIRDSIGQSIVPAGGTEPERSPNEEIRDADGNVVKPAGGISQTDIETTLAFNNGLTLLTLTKAEIVALLEHGVSALPGVSGRFPQVGGVEFSVDLAQPEGSRIVNAAIVDADGTATEALVRDGAIVGDADETFRIVTLDFLARPRFDEDGVFIGGGDGYPFPNTDDPAVAARVNPVQLSEGGARTGEATFADDGSEQDALAEYLADNFATPETAFDEADDPRAGDERIQFLGARDDTVLEGLLDVPQGTDELGAITEAVRFDSGVGDGGSEVVAHEDGRLYVTNGEAGAIDVFDIASGELAKRIDLSFLPGFDGVQSVAVSGGLIAAAVQVPSTTSEAFGRTIEEASNGYVVLIDGATHQVIDRVTVGVLPDQITFTPDGTKILVANEGEFSGESTLDRDPIGSISIVDVSDLAAPTVKTVDFSDFDGLEFLARQEGIRLAPGASLLRGLEPEFIAVSPDGSLAYVTLQEANAVAILDLATHEIVAIRALGTLDHSLEGNELDPLDDGQIGLRTFDDLVGLRMPDAVATFEQDGRSFFVTANEGDGRGDVTDGPEDVPNPQRADEARLGDVLDGEVPGVAIDPSVETEGLERLTISLIDGDVDGDGDIDVLHSFGTRSFTIFDAVGNVVFDSGSEFERILSERAPERFNNDDGEPIAEEDDNRSDAKGPEPEAVAIGAVDGELYAFIGAERDGGVFVYNISTPAEAYFVDYIPGFVGADGITPEDDVAPETIAFIPAEESVSGVAQIAVAYEVSGTTVVYDLGALEGGAASPLISEFAANPPGGDPATVDFELSGEAGAAFSGALVFIESDAGGANPGDVNNVVTIEGTFDANGILSVGIEDFENPSFTVVLTESFDGDLDTDFDADDDGTPDQNADLFGEIFDAVGTADAAGDVALLYGAALGGTDLGFVGDEPELIFRDGSRGAFFQVGDLDGAGDQVFDAAGDPVDEGAFSVDPRTPTFGAVNPTFGGDGGPADFDLQITELWFGQEGTDLTEDWIEVTNVGPEAWTPAEGALFYDDESADPALADAVFGLDGIAAGESVIIIVGDAADAAAFSEVWADDADLLDVQVGWADGAGLGQGGDAATLFIEGEAGLSALDTEGFPDAAGNSGRSWDVASGRFSTVEGFDGVSETTERGGTDGDEPAVASPGLIPTVDDGRVAIHAIQGAGASSPLEDQRVATSGVVTEVFLGTGAIGGFFMQDPLGDGDAATSEGIFVFAPDVSVSVGDAVTFEGLVTEFFGRTQLSAVTDFAVVSSGNALPDPVRVLVDGSDYEAVEGMLVEAVSPVAGDTLEITDVFNLGRFGEAVLAPDVNVQPTQAIDPTPANAAAIEERAERNLAERLIVDDGRGEQNPSVKVLVEDAGGGRYDVSDPATEEGPTLRVGASFDGVVGAMDFGFGAYRLQRGTPLEPVPGSNDRPEKPDVGGDLQVASFNALNFFTTLDDGSLTPGGLDPRGADDAGELARQTEKLVSAIAALEAEVIGLQEIENNGYGAGSAVATLVAALNAEAGADVWSFVDYTAEAGGDGLLGADAITTGIIYRNDAVTLTGQAALVFEEASAADTFALAEVLNPSVAEFDRLEDLQRNRPATAASFEDAAGNAFTVVNNHFKSKGDSDLEDLAEAAQAALDAGGVPFSQADVDALLADPNYDQGDGQAFWNAVRADAAREIAAWLETDPTGVADEDVLVIGDLNAYGLEDPVDALEAEGFEHAFGGAPEDESFVFFGQKGALDHVFATPSAAAQVTGTATWASNAFEPRFLDYDTTFEDPAFFNADGPYRASDHDPVLTGLALGEPETVAGEAGFDNVFGEDRGEVFVGFGTGATLDFVDIGDGGRDVIVLDGDAARDGEVGLTIVESFEVGVDRFELVNDVQIRTAREVDNAVQLILDTDGDIVHVNAVESVADLGIDSLVV